jgi:DnaA family protein
MLFTSPAALDDTVLSRRPEVAIVDRVDEADERAAGVLFTLYNALKEHGGRLLAASRAPLSALRVREDLRTRLGWGLVYEVMPLADAEKAAAMSLYAQQRGFELGSEVIEYLLRHGRRDMPSLLRTLAALDHYSLAAKRPITVPLIRGWLQKEIDWESQTRAKPGA